MDSADAIDHFFRRLSGKQPHRDADLLDQYARRLIQCAVSRLRTVLHSLNDRERRVFELHLENVEIPMIAQRLRRSERTVRRSLEHIERLLERF